uniref:Uncharacterized protein n=1 Tax=Rhizophora mucronata TaxID=61149 RepID=A0A2P2JG61_RHIMU
MFCVCMWSLRSLVMLLVMKSGKVV